ncbi:hypothetical protein THAOC_13943 [Thalassiosira oceanica]|uniref:Uncharacterized protein n=1 Tax=Thalassiosira oceanica TaxID=159749 RepID=K0T4G9_THAOC|nr:hypothetical protein THAOC_13943 [Thalassiosira oceanica]|eukprot:EJK65227.1 hypothetical protein THAOC_13943 [Thalassiosira oceanica]
MSDYQQLSPIGYSRASISDAGQDILRNNNAGTKVYVPTVEFGSKHGAEALLLTLEEWIRARTHLNTGVAPQHVITVATLWSFVLRLVTGAFRERWIALSPAQHATKAQILRRSRAYRRIHQSLWRIARLHSASLRERTTTELGGPQTPAHRLSAQRFCRTTGNGIQSILSDPAIDFDLISQTLMRYSRFHVPTDKKKSGKRKRDGDGDDASNGGNGDGGKSKKNKNGKSKRDKRRRAEKAGDGGRRGGDADVCTLGFCNRDGKTPNHSNADCKWQKKGLQGPQWWNSNGNDNGNGHRNQRNQVRNPRQGQGQGYRPEARDASFFADVIGNAVAAALGARDQGFQGQGPPQGQNPFQPPAQREVHFADGYGPSQGSGAAFEHMRHYDSRRISSGPVGHIPGYEAGCRAHSHAPTEGVARRGFDGPMRREMTEYGDGLGARGSLPLPLGLDSLYCGDVAVPTLGPFDTSLACAELYASTLSNDCELDTNQKFEVYMKEKCGGGINTAIAASYDALISDAELEAYRRGQQPSLPDFETSKPAPDGDLIPCVYAMVATTQGISEPNMLRTLLDSGTFHTLIHIDALPPGVEIHRTEKQNAMQTMAGTFMPMGYVKVKDIRLPEFDRHLAIDGDMCYVFDAPCRYQMIAGRNFLRRAGIDLKFVENHITWMGKSIPMKSSDFAPADYNAVFDDIAYWIDEDEMDLNDFYLTEMMPAQYEKADLSKFAAEQTHLSQVQQNDLLELWQRHEKLFDGTLGKYTGDKMHIDLLPDAKPHYSRPYPVTRDKGKLLKDELDRMEKIGVIERTGDSVWGAGTFPTPKKDGTIRVVADLRALNKAIVSRSLSSPEVSLLDGPFAFERVHREIVLLQASQDGFEQVEMFLPCQLNGLSISPCADVVDVAIAVFDITQDLLHLGLSKGGRVLETHGSTAVVVKSPVLLLGSKPSSRKVLDHCSSTFWLSYFSLLLITNLNTMAWSTRYTLFFSNGSMVRSGFGGLQTKFEV